MFSSSKVEITKIPGAKIEKSCSNLRLIYLRSKDSVDDRYKAYNPGGDKFIGDEILYQDMLKIPIADMMMEIRCSLEKQMERCDIEMRTIDKGVNAAYYKKWFKITAATRALIKAWKDGFIERSSEIFYNFFMDTLSNLKEIYVAGNRKLKYSLHDWQKFVKQYGLEPKAIGRFTPVSAYCERVLKSGERPDVKVFWFNLVKMYEIPWHKTDEVHAFVRTYSTPAGYDMVFTKAAAEKMLAKTHPDAVVAVRAPPTEDKSAF